MKATGFITMLIAIGLVIYTLIIGPEVGVTEPYKSVAVAVVMFSIGFVLVVIQRFVEGSKPPTPPE